MESLFDNSIIFVVPSIFTLLKIRLQNNEKILIVIILLYMVFITDLRTYVSPKKTYFIVRVNKYNCIHTTGESNQIPNCTIGFCSSRCCCCCWCCSPSLPLPLLQHLDGFAWIAKQVPDKNTSCFPLLRPDSHWLLHLIGKVYVEFLHAIQNYRGHLQILTMQLLLWFHLCLLQKKPEIQPLWVCFPKAMDCWKDLIHEVL